MFTLVHYAACIDSICQKAGGWDLTEMHSFYHPPTKLQEGNVFSCVCLSTLGIPCDHYPWWHWTSLPPVPALPLPPLNMEPHCTGPLSSLWTVDLTVQDFPSGRAKTGDLFKLTYFRLLNLVAIKQACMVGKSCTGMLLVCCVSKSLYD